MLRKEFLQVEQKMDAGKFVNRAREMAASLENRELAAARSRPLARQLAARLAGVSASLFHSLRYRPPKRIAAESYQKLCIAVERQAKHQLEKLEHEIYAARACRLVADDRSIREAEASVLRGRTILNKGE